MFLLPFEFGYVMWGPTWSSTCPFSVANFGIRGLNGAESTYRTHIHQLRIVRAVIVPLKAQSVYRTYEALYLGFHVPRMELKIMATILDETGVDSGGILMGVARRSG